MSYYPPHEARDAKKLENLRQAIRDGDIISPIVVAPNGIYALTGSHRIAAHEAECVENPALMMTDDDYNAVREYLSLGPHDIVEECCSFDDIASAIWMTTKDKDIKDAVEDQR